MDTKSTQKQTVPETEPEIKRTSLNVPVEIWEEFRVAAIRRKLTATEALEAALRAWVADSKAA